MEGKLTSWGTAPSSVACASCLLEQERQSIIFACLSKQRHGVCWCRRGLPCTLAMPMEAPIRRKTLERCAAHIYTYFFAGYSLCYCHILSCVASRKNCLPMEVWWRIALLPAKWSIARGCVRGGEQSLRRHTHASAPALRVA